MTGIFELIVLLVVLGCIWNSSGARAMVDLVSTRLQEVYGRWEPRPALPRASSPSPSSTTPTGASPAAAPLSTEDRMSGIAMRRMVSYQRSQRRAANKDITKQLHDRKLFQIKDLHWDTLRDGKQRPLMGLCCATCNRDSRANAVDSTSDATSLKNILQTEYSADSTFLSRTFKHIAQTWSVQKFNYPSIYETVLEDERLKEAINVTAQEQCNQRGETSQEAFQKLVHQHEIRAKRILDEMRSKLSDFLLRLTSWILLKLLPCFLTSVVVHPAQAEMLKRAGRSGLPLIFLPLHRSHLDYILVSFILLNINVKAPMVAAGDNLNIPLFGGLLRGLGAFFIKRRIDPVAGRRDTVYRAILHTYMMQSLQAGHNIEFFAEGGRSRTGKACMPKGGLLSVIVDAYMDGTVEDALLVPVSLNYEKLVDGNFTREQMGQPKQMESFTSAIRGIWKTLTSNYGAARIDFNQPFSLREMVSSFQQSRPTYLPLDFEKDEDEEPVRPPTKPEKRVLQSTPSSSSLYGTDIVVEEHRQLVDSIARHIIHDCTRSTAVMSTNVVAFLLLTAYREGVSLDELAVALDNTRKELEWAGRDCGFSGESVDVINHAVSVLGPGLVKREKQKTGGRDVIVIKPITMLPNVIELTYYSNGVLSHYCIDAAVALAIYSLVGFDPAHPSKDQTGKTVSQKEVIESTKDVCDLLHFEFIFTKACQNLDTVIIEAIHSLQTSEALSEDQKMMTEDEAWSRRYAHDLENDSDGEEEEVFSSEYKVNINNKEAMRKLQHHQRILRPLLDAYYVTAVSTRFLLDREVPEGEFMKHILSEIETHLDHGYIKYAESMSTDTVKNALKLLEKWNVIECHTQDRIKLYYLHPDFEEMEQLAGVAEYISKFNVDYPCDDAIVATP